MKNALILSGGGAKAAYEAGVVQSLNQLDFSFDIVTGTSAGAFNATLIAGNQQTQLLDLWRNISASDIYRLRIPLWLAFLIPSGLIYWIVNSKKAIYDNKPFLKLLQNTIDFKKIIESQIHLIIIADDLVSKKRVTFTNKTLIRGDSPKRLAIPLTAANIIDAILASVPIPGLFSPFPMNQHMLVDGGLTHNAPIGAAIDAGADRLYCILNSPVRPRISEISTIPDIVNASLDMMITSMMESDILEARLKNLVTGKKHVDIHVIRPLKALPPATLEFNPEKIEEAIKIGLKAPILQHISFKEARSGFRLEIQGYNFESSKGKVFINQSEMEMTRWTEKEIIIEIPENIPTNFNILTIQTSVGTIDKNLEIPRGKSV
ncbi:MAG: patatin-like phospholipase family protein [Nitrospirae bacterium]|nr:patatin-like phospholipase family protein [Nitrospirota bacterium]MBI3351308.1 patatin-like phospholipase family protein [Nitrospirota bacterium]